MGFRKASSVPSEQVLTTHDFIYQDCAWVGIKFFFVPFFKKALVIMMVFHFPEISGIL